MQWRSQVITTTPNHKRYLDDFIKNKVYYGLRSRLDLGEGNMDIPDAGLCKLCLDGGLMARIAHSGQVVYKMGGEVIVWVLQASWGSTREAPAFVSEVSVS